MKKVLLAVCLMFGGATLVSAQTDPSSSPSQTQTSQDQDQDRQQISVSELPDAVTSKLEGQDYSGWTVGNAYKKMDESNQEMYIVELRQGTETKKVKFDKDGNELDKGKDKSDNSNYRSDSPTDPSTTPESTTPETQTQDQSTTPDQSSTPDQSTTPDQSATPEHSDNSSTTEQQ
ncbi:MAG: hypothetical protein M3Y60_05950 [Bacteroidota bacterium]|nr:hypothetical protein [Bacteroidota bacterium]